MTRMFQTLGNTLTGQGDTLKLRCSGCGHEAVWDASRALATLGAHARPFDVTARLICSRCGQRRITAWI